MKPLNVALLMILSILWGASFIFMRYLSPIFGPVTTADMRILIGGGVLCIVFFFTGVRLDWRKKWKQYAFIGILNSGAPFLLYSFAALHIPGSVSSIMNSLAPIFGAVFSAIWLQERLNLRKVIGLFAGITGVIIITSTGSIEPALMSYLAVGACVCATICYGLAGVYVKKRAAGSRPGVLAATSQVLAGIIIFPFIFASPPVGPVRLSLVGILIAFAVLCSALAYLIYYKLLAEDGPTKALTVTFLIPLFGMLFGRLFLAEELPLSAFFGVCFILVGTGLVIFRGRKVL